MGEERLVPGVPCISPTSPAQPAPQASHLSNLKAPSHLCGEVPVTDWPLSDTGKVGGIEHQLLKTDDNMILFIVREKGEKMHIKQVQGKGKTYFQFPIQLYSLPILIPWSPGECIKQLLRCELYLPNHSEAVRLGVKVAPVLQSRIPSLPQP